jgi:hypothetical protein
MVAMFEVGFLIICLVLGLWWFRRTNLYRAHRRSPGQFDDTNSMGSPPPGTLGGPSHR